MSIYNRITSSAAALLADTTTSISQGGIAAKILDKASELCSDLFVMGKEMLFEHPTAAVLMTVGTIALATGLFYFNREIPPPSIDKAVTEISEALEKDESLAKKHVTGYVQSLFLSTQFKTDIGESAINPKFADYLSKKILNVCERNISPEGKRVIIQNLVQDAATLMKDASRRLQMDIKEENLQCFGVGKDAVVDRMEPLGDESHNGGKIPLLITFKGGEKIVYKPRSMLPEKVLCDHETGLLKEAGFGTYYVVCGEDSQGHFGYSEFIENTREENTVSSKEQVEEYLGRLCLLDKLGQALGLSDLHYLNIITKDLQPYIIDAEVFLNPEGIRTGVMEENGPAFVFDIYEGKYEDFEGKNKIWFTPALDPKGKFKYRMKDKHLKAIRVDRESIHHSTEIPKPVQARIEDAKGSLEQEKGRFILMTTPELKNAMPSIDPLNSDSADDLIGQIIRAVESGDFVFVKESRGDLREQILKDAAHNDLPAFYFDSTTNEIIYNGIVIANMNEKESILGNSSRHGVTVRR